MRLQIRNGFIREKRENFGRSSTFFLNFRTLLFLRKVRIWLDLEKTVYRIEEKGSHLTNSVVRSRKKREFTKLWLVLMEKVKVKRNGGTVSGFFFFGKSFPRKFSVNGKNVFRQKQKPFRCFVFCRKSVFLLTEKYQGETVSRKRKKGKVRPRFLELSLFSLKKVKVLCKLLFLNAQKSTSRIFYVIPDTLISTRFDVCETASITNCQSRTRRM